MVASAPSSPRRPPARPPPRSTRPAPSRTTCRAMPHASAPDDPGHGPPAREPAFRVLLVHMPFADIKRPAIGLSLLKARLARAGREGARADHRTGEATPTGARLRGGSPRHAALAAVRPRRFQHDVPADPGGAGPGQARQGGASPG